MTDDCKNIIIIGSAYPLRGGGLSTFNERLARELKKGTSNVTIFTFSLQYPSFLFPGKSQLSSEPAPTDLDIRVRINSINPFNWISVGREIGSLKPDLIIVRYWLPFMGPCLGTILRCVRKNKYTKIICIADNIIPHEKRIGDKAFTKYFIQPIDAFITLSQNVLNDLRSFSLNKPARLLTHPLYDNFGMLVSKKEARKHLQLDENGKILLFFGFIRKYKGLDLLIQAIADERIKNQDIKLLIAGEFYDDSKTYLNLIKQLGIEDQVILHTNFITDNEVKWYCCAADAFVQPYKSATQSGVTPLATYFEKPIILTNVGGLPDMVKDGLSALVCSPSVDGLVQQILRYYALGDEHFLPHIQAQKKQLSWSSFTSSIKDLYSHLRNN